MAKIRIISTTRSGVQGILDVLFIIKGGEYNKFVYDMPAQQFLAIVLDLPLAISSFKVSDKNLKQWLVESKKYKQFFKGKD